MPSSCTPTLPRPAALQAGSRQRADGNPRGVAFSEWIATFGSSGAPDPQSPGPAGWQASRPREGERGLVLWSAPEAAPPQCARRGSCEAILDGILHDRDELREQLGLPKLALNDAGLVLEAYRRWDEHAFERLRGLFAVLLYDGDRDVLFALRDQMGVWPLFHARANRAFVFSSRVDALLRHPQVSREVDRVVAAERLCARWPVVEDTFYAAVKRVPPGHRLRVSADRVSAARYWDPPSSDDAIDFVGEEAVEQFDELFHRAVARCLKQGPLGLFLSGGLDSVSVGMSAADLARATGRPLPVALGVGFPVEESDEEWIQRGVASGLGLPLEFETFDSALNGDSLLERALEMNRASGLPMDNMWAPVYLPLRNKARERGCRGILTGNGGDEWMTVSSYVAADLIRSGDLIGLVRHMNMTRRSFPLNRLAPLRQVWRYGVLPLAGAAAAGVAPAWYNGGRARRQIESTPTWVAPDPSLRKALDERAPLTLTDPRPRGGFYFRDARAALSHMVLSMEHEATHELDRRTGVVSLHPYWDVDLVSLLYRTPIGILSRGGRSKGLVRESVNRRLPGLGFKVQKKTGASRLYEQIIYNEGPQIWRAIDGTIQLDELGIADRRAVDGLMRSMFARRPEWESSRIWGLLLLETWTRSRKQAGRHI